MLNVGGKLTYLVSELLCVVYKKQFPLGMVPDLKKLLVLEKNGPMRNNLNVIKYFNRYMYFNKVHVQNTRKVSDSPCQQK